MIDRLNPHLPVAVLGAGSVGLAAAAHLVARGLTPLILEAGTQVAANLETYRHVRLFSPWQYNVDKAAGRLLVEAGWRMPPLEQLPTAVGWRGTCLWYAMLHLLACRCTCCWAALASILLFGTKARAVACFCVLYGLSNGVLTIVRGTLPQALFGSENYGAISGAMAGPALLAKAAGPVIGALLLGGHAAPQLVLGLLFAAAVLSLVFYVAAVRAEPDGKMAPAAPRRG